MRSRRPRASASSVFTLVMPTEEPRFAGFTNSGRPRSAAAAVTARSVGVPLAARHGEKGNDRDAGGLQQPLLDVLVHADGGTQHPGADVRHVCQLEEALNRSVFAVRAVQYREHDIQPAQRRTSARQERSDRVLPGVGGSNTSVPVPSSAGSAASVSRRNAGSSSTCQRPARSIPIRVTSYRDRDRWHRRSSGPIAARSRAHQTGRRR